MLYFQVPASRCSSLRAEVAELADAQASGACSRKRVEVQILSSAPRFRSPFKTGSFLRFSYRKATG